MNTKSILGTILSIALGIYIFVAMLPQPLAELADITNKNVTLDTGVTTFGAVVNASVITMIGLIVLIVPIIFLMKYVNEIRGK
jgi:hypothetical protein